MSKSVHHDGFSLLELSLSLAVLGLLMASLMPLQRLLEQKRQDALAQREIDLWMSQIEGFAITHRRLPCPATDAEGQEQTVVNTGPCVHINGLLPWRSMGLPRPSQSPLYAVANLETAGSPFANTLTRQDGIRAVSMDLLSAVIFAGPDTSGASPATLPALLVQDDLQNATSVSSTLLPGMPCSGSLFLTVSAVAVISTGTDNASQFTGTNRCYAPPGLASKKRMAWLSYERLMWIYLKAGLLIPP